MDLTGGYILHKLDAVSTSVKGHTTALERPWSEFDLDALNTIQATPWRINRWVLDVMAEAWARGIKLGGLEVGEPEATPRLPDDVWQAMGEADRAEHRRRLHQIHSANASIVGRSQAVLDCLAVAQELRDEPAIWYPHRMDFRGRVYPAANRGPNPQGSDIAKSLLMFANGLPLGPDGEFWLMVRAANCFGQDKLPLEERVAWTLSNLTSICESAADPISSRWWTEADEPWGFLATCHELRALESLPSDSRHTFVSHLPIPLDGSCNGLQHLSAMGLDPVGAAATNLRARQPRQDVYERVAQRVRELVEADVVAGVDEARVWHGAVNRKTVKRAVMTTPYGVTDRGIRDQLLFDGMVPETEDVGKGAAAEYLKDKLVQALGDTVVAAKSVMAWLQTTADRLARAGVPFRWTTPTGSTIEQSYRVAVRKDVQTLCGRLILVDAPPDAPLNARKQALGASPNFIHSFDAAHLKMTVNAGTCAGITDWAMIHDSFGTHAANTTRLNAILREQFVAIYEVDRLKILRDEIATYAPHVALPELPARGDFNIKEVLDAEFFFS